LALSKFTLSDREEYIMGKIFDRIYEEVKKIPKGNVATYGEIAKRAKTSPRVVGFALHRNPDPANIPCHRVVFRDGSLSSSYAFGGKEAQEKKLEEEGFQLSL
jgi:methylated-DNA-protein-cysteine methyltransferase-like protein